MTTTMQCPDCLGTRQIVTMRPVRLGQPLQRYQPCPRCDGTGEVPYPKPRSKFGSRGEVFGASDSSPTPPIASTID
jgi:hypothetical protein